VSEPSARERTTALLAELRAQGAERWDAPGLAVVDRLLAQAEHAPEELAVHLLERAHVHVQHLQEAFTKARQRGASALTRLRSAEHPAEALIARALAEGDTFMPRRLLRRAPAATPRLRDALRQSLTEQLDAQAVARGISSPGLIDAPVVPARSSARPLAMAQSLYRDAAAGASARMTLAKTTASVPPDAGHYHAVHVGARTLEEAARFPAYLKALLARLETLGVLWHHGASEPARKSKRAAR
jgi:hypothetical protein